MANASLAAPDKIAGSYDLEWGKGDGTGQPACVDHWTLRADSALTVESGQEKLTGRWHVEGKAKEGEWLVWTGLKTNGLPDCRGRMASQPIADRRMPFYVNAAGGLVLTEPYSRLQDGTIVWRPTAVANKVVEKH